MSTIHVLPIDDSAEHEESTICKCEPVVEFLEWGMRVVHNAYDGRAVAEKAQEILEAKP